MLSRDQNFEPQTETNDPRSGLKKSPYPRTSEMDSNENFSLLPSFIRVISKVQPSLAAKQHQTASDHKDSKEFQGFKSCKMDVGLG